MCDYAATAPRTVLTAHRVLPQQGFAVRGGSTSLLPASVLCSNVLKDIKLGYNRVTRYM